MELNWMKCVGDVWCKLNAVNLDHSHFDGLKGVYVIWHGGTTASVVYVGQGTIRDRLREHRIDGRIQEFKEFDLYVTWAPVDQTKRDGVERYLAEFWQPLVANRHPEAEALAVNSPW